MDYLCMRAWYKWQGYSPEDIEAEIENARRSNAPETAIFRKHDGDWAIYEDIVNRQTKRIMQELIEEISKK